MTSPVNAANATSVAGYALALWWLQGGPTAAAIGSIAADELDGPIARLAGTPSDFGGTLDWAIDLTLTGLVAHRLGALWLLLPVTAGQAYLRSRGLRPSIGSARAAMMLAAIALEHGRRRKRRRRRT